MLTMDMTSGYKTIVAKNAAEATYNILTDIAENGEEIEVRGNKTRELSAVTTVIENPEERFILLPARKPNYFAAIAESLWVLAGRNDIEWLSFYLKRAPEFSDDGKVWRGGYGPRIRNKGGVDQLEHVIRLLREDPNTRRAVISIYDGALDLNVVTKDVPCNDLIQFKIRDGYLDMYVFVRSQDVIWGFSGINTFEWSLMQGIVATMVGVKVGKFVQFCGSEHYYLRHDALVNSVLGSGQFDVYSTLNLQPMKLGSLYDDELRKIFEEESRMRADGYVRQMRVFREELEGWGDIIIALNLYVAYKCGNLDNVVEVIRRLNEEDEDFNERKDIVFAINEFFLRKRVITKEWLCNKRSEDYYCGFYRFMEHYKNKEE